ncbi:MAG: MYXO-CTERM sorting domain-containing protein [Kofleriaceae bacterium]
MTAFLAYGAFGAVASADVTVGQPTVTTVWNATADDPARVRGTGQDAYLRKTDEEQSNEMSVAAFSGTRGIFVEMRSSSIMVNNTLTAPNFRMQGACAPIELKLSAAGAVEAQKLPGERFLTNSRGNEYRQFNHPEVEKLTDATATQPALFAVFYNAQLNSNDTKKYMMVVDQNCQTVPVTGGQNGQAAPTANNPGVVVIAKNNDDCSMNQDGKSGTMLDRGTDQRQYVHWAGCNGNGNDDGWVNSIGITVNRDANGAATSVAVKKYGDVSVAKQEERSRGLCSAVKSDPNLVFCTYNQGNNQPQREGTWAAAIDMTPNQAPKIVWTKQIEGRKQLDLGGGKTARTYSSRIMHAPVLDAQLQPTDSFILRTGDLQGNNTNNRKGGKYLTMMVGLAEGINRNAPPTVTMTNVQSQIAGTDGTHLIMAPVVLGANATPGALLLQGTHTGASGQSATARLMTVVDGKVQIEARTIGTGTPYDRHLYSNYLGNNPGNQGRGFGKAFAMVNPLYGQGGNKDKVLLITATNGKDASQPESMYKQSSYLSVTPVVSDATASGQSGNGGGAGGAGQGGGATDGDTSVGGCSTGSGSTGLASLLLLGLVAIRRRRR